jgi:hypothetical protein
VGKFSIRLLLSSILRARQAMGRLLSWSGVLHARRLGTGGPLLPRLRRRVPAPPTPLLWPDGCSRDVVLRRDATLRWSPLCAWTSSSSPALRLNLELLGLYSIPTKDDGGDQNRLTVGLTD